MGLIVGVMAAVLFAVLIIAIAVITVLIKR